MARTSLPQCAGLLTHPFQIGGERRLGAAVTVAFSLLQPHELRAQAELWPALAPWLPDIGALDAGLPKPGGEWLLAGTSHAPGAQPMAGWQAAVALGRSRKTLQLHGPRTAAAGPGATAATAQPVRSVPVRWPLAWGGPEVAENPQGCGSRAAADAGAQGPQVELPAHPWRGPDLSCVPAGTLPLPLTHPARQPRGGLVTPDYLDTAFPGHPAGTDRDGFRLAPLDQRIDTPWTGDEAFMLTHWHPDHPRLAGRLPGLRAVLHVGGEEDAEAGDGGLRPVPLALSTVWFFPDLLTGVLVFHGDVPVTQLDGADVQRQIVGLEALGAPARPVADYAALWRQRTARTVEAGLAAMDDGLLIPPGYTCRFDALAQARPRHDFQARLARTLDAAFDDALARAAAPAPGPAPSPAQAAHKAQVLASLQHELAQARAAQAALAGAGSPAGRHAALAEWADRSRAQARTRLDDLSARLQAPWWPQTLAAQASQRATTEPPAPAALMQQLDTLEHLLAAPAAGQADARPAQPPQMPQTLPHTPPREALDDLRRLLADGPDAARAGAHAAPPGVPPPPGPAPAREAVQAGLAAWLDHARALQATAPPAADPAALLAQARALTEAGDPAALGTLCTFRPLDGTRPPPAADDHEWQPGAHLRQRSVTRLDLRGRDLRGLHLEAVTLRECDLRGALLQGAVLTDCTFAQCDLADVQWPQGRATGSTFLQCRLDGMDAAGLQAHRSQWLHCEAPASRWGSAQFSECILHGGGWPGASFDGTVLARTTFSGMALAGAGFAAVDAQRSAWNQCDLGGASFAQAQLLRCGFVPGVLPGDWRGSRLTAVSLRGAALRASQWQTARLDGVDWSGADLREADLHGLQAHCLQALRTDLRGSLLQGVRIEHGVLLAADLRGATLRDTILQSCWLGEVRIDAQGDPLALATPACVWQPRPKEAQP